MTGQMGSRAKKKKLHDLHWRKMRFLSKQTADGLNSTCPSSAWKARPQVQGELLGAFGTLLGFGGKGRLGRGCPFCMPEHAMDSWGPTHTREKRTHEMENTRFRITTTQNEKRKKKKKKRNTWTEDVYGRPG
jgi:hypothetical protein